ncbi:hypothetical protein B9Z51_00345 [Limnohabitans sp. T6-5]|uniref:hypothetical protein n=1 Tax=Limnohabitans sp. T6-5 TaxID=1100724 RepID=UPI000DD1A54B|nr:hypothetical protein [Limnohabitans sp. T6-5]PUE10841.1 hypothetical protein B9Z51_00345 [Limnohabitans sp. T6-5]
MPIVRVHHPAPMSEAQQGFNRLLARIALLSGHIERLQAWSNTHRYAHLQVLRDSAEQALALNKSLLLFVHERLNAEDLTAQQQRMARSKVRSLLALLPVQADPQVQVVAALYAAEDDADAAEEQAEAAQRLREKIEAAWGQPINNPGLYATPEEMMAAAMRQWQRQAQADDERKAAKRAARKAQKKPAAQQKAQTAQADAKTALRTIFRQLASALHPDREPDAQERERKTALMSEVNAAYERHDLTTLLRLQMQLTQVDPSAGKPVTDDKLAAMALLLKEQVAALEDDLLQLQDRLSREFCVRVSADVAEACLTQALQRLQADQRHAVDSLSGDLRRIQNAAELKRWLKEQALQAKQAARD